MTLVDYYENEYDSQIAADEAFASSFRKPFDRLLARASGQYILDVGCGTGAVTAPVSEKNFVFGIDASTHACHGARSHGIRAVRADCEQFLPFRDHSFDLAICREVCEHLLTPDRLVQNIRRVLKPEGRLFVTVPNHFSWEKRLSLLRGANLAGSSRYFGPQFEEWNYPHIRFFTWRGFTKMLKSQGFDVIADHSLFAAPPPLIPGRIWARLARRVPDLGLGQFVLECCPA